MEPTSSSGKGKIESMVSAEKAEKFVDVEEGKKIFSKYGNSEERMKVFRCVAADES